MGKFNPHTYNRIREEVRHYLDLPEAQRKAILFYGNGGEGKSYLVNELKDEMKAAGYNKFYNGGVPNHMKGRSTRSTSNKFKYTQVTSISPEAKDDSTFQVFDFTH